MTVDLNQTDDFIANLGVAGYRVGGSVRDQMLGRKVKDADYVVRDMSLYDLGRLLVKRGAKVLPLTLRDGQQGGWRAIYKGTPIEIMLPRTEVSTGPRHQDFKLIIDPSLPLEVDAQRRDFTFNALYQPIGLIWDGPVLDPLGCGIEDLRRRRINVTHPDSFRDDPLRILRALRFVSTLGYELGPDTRALMLVHANAVTGLTAAGHSSGTVKDELVKLLMGEDPATALRLARDTGVLAVAFPELAAMLGFDQGSRYHDMTTDEHTFTALETAAKVDAPLRVRLALLYHDAGKPEAAWTDTHGRKHYYAARVQVGDTGWSRLTEDHEVVGERLWRAAAERMSIEKSLREDVAMLIRNHMVPCQKVDPVKVRRERVRLGDRLYHDLLLMRMCDLSGKGAKNRQFLANIGEMENLRKLAWAAEVPAGLGDLEVNGRDVAAAGARGRDIGRVLAAVLDEVVVDPREQKLTREWQLGAAKRLI